MDYNKLNYKLYIILNGYFNISINGEKYKVVYPSLESKYKAEELYVEIMEFGKFETEYLNNQQVDSILKYHKIWSEESQERLDFLTNIINEKKLELYKEYSNKENRASIKSELKNIKELIQKLNNKKSTLDYLKLEHFAASMKNQYLISQRILYENGDKVFDEDYNNLDSPKLSKFLKPIEEKTISSQDLRNIVKGDLWSSYTVQENIFGPTINLNDDQRNLLAFHRMYTNVRQHPECPSDEIIDDDDALDGWFLFQKEKKKKEEIKNNLLSRVRGKVGRHSDIFIIAQNQEEANIIHEMNNLEGKRTIAQINQTVKEKGNIKWQDIPIVRQQLINEKGRKI